MSSRVASIFFTIITSLFFTVAHAQENAASAAADKQSVVMVLDGSGSMWGQIDGVAKIEVARGVISDLLGDWDENVHMGLIAYGHREKGACGDIETLVDVGPVDATSVMAKINAINPVGKTPISASVMKAAETLKFTEEKATVILVSDGIETCNADPCALAKELESKGVDFTAHVIGFDVAEADQASLSCLAETTGGKFISAQNADELTDALTQTVAAVKEPEPVKVAEPAVEPEEQGVKLTAKLCDICEALDDDVFWRVFKPETDLEGNREQIKASGNASPFMDLAVGSYYVTAKHGDAIVGGEVSVEADKTSMLEIILGAGNLKLNAISTAGGEALDDNMFYRVFTPPQGLSGERKQLSASGNATPIFHLPAGDYIIFAKHGEAIIETPLTVTAGELTEHTFDMNVGYVKLATSMAEGGSAIEKDLFYRVLNPTKDLEGKRQQIAASGSETPLFRLPAGEYIITVKHGASVRETPITVTAGGLTEKMLAQNSGMIRAKLVSQAGGDALDGGVFWRVLAREADLEGKRDQISASGGASPILALPAGDFILQARYGGENIEKEFSLTAGEEKIVEVIASQ